MLEQPKAMSAARAFLKPSRVIICLAVIPFSSISITCIPACLASAILRPLIAGIVPLPGRPRPKTSVRQFIEFAVNIPEQEPQPGQAAYSNSLSCVSDILPAEKVPTASNISDRERFLPE